MQGRVVEWEKHLHLQSVDSTNDYIRRDDVPAGSWVTATEQTHGRGRGQHSWTAIGAERLIFSAKVEPGSMPTPDLPVRIGGAVLRACRAVCGTGGEELQLKWPNDIFRRGKKIGGILVEAESGKTHVLVIGIGINIFGTEPPPGLPGAGFLLDRPITAAEEKLSRSIIAEINIVLRDAANLDSRRAELDWIEKNSYLQGRRIRAKSDQGVVMGRVRGLSDDGYLRLESQDGGEFRLSDAASEIQIIPD